MPLSEFPLKAAESKSTATQSKMNNLSSGQFSMPDHELSELLWENGQIIMHDHSSRSRSSVPTTYIDRNQEKDNGDAINPKNAQLSAVDLLGNEFPSVQDEDIVPWINSPIYEPFHPDPLQNNFCSDFMEEFAHANPNNLTSHAYKNGDLGHEIRNIQTTQHEHGPTAPAKRLDSGISKTRNLFQPAPHCPSSVADTYARVLEAGTGCSNNAQMGVELVTSRLDKQNATAPRPPQPKASASANLMNFSLFSRPVAVAKSNLEIVDRLRSGDKVCSPVASNRIESKLESIGGVKSIARSQGPLASGHSNFNLKPFEKPHHTVVPRNRLETIYDLDAPIKDDNIAKGTSSTARTALTRIESEKAPEAVVASSSVCSVNSTGVEPDDSKRGEKRRVHELEYSSGNPSEDFDDESAGGKKPALARGQCSKRSRATEVHNLSERRRRERINEKMRALQELVPNCNKTDKASMLEDAIEYLKTLQLQVQIMSMGGGLHMPPMLLPPGMQHMRAPHMAHFSPMGVGMGMGMGMGYGMGVYDLNAPPGCPVIPVPTIHGTQLPCPPICGPPLLPRMIGTLNPPMFGAPGQSFPASLSMPDQPGFSTDRIGKMSSVPEFTAPAASPAPSSGATLPSSDQKQETQRLEASKQD